MQRMGSTSDRTVTCESPKQCIREQEGNWVFIDMIKGGLLALLSRLGGCHSSRIKGTTSGDGSIEKKQTPRQQSINITLQCTFKNETWHGTDGIYVVSVFASSR